MGLRQVGKTTIVRQLLASISTPSHFVVADAVASSNGFWIEQQWETIRFSLRTSEANKVDFAIEGKIIGLEIKSGITQSVKGIKHFKEK